MACRVAQYAGFVRAASSSQYHYVVGADPGRLTRLLRTGDLKADDATHAIDSAAEDEVLDAIARADWSALHSDRALPDAATRQTMRRRWMFRPVDTIRAWMPVGDR
jgi:hypothetical protein